MRWRHADPNRSEEREYVQTTVARIDAWWREFAAKAADLTALFTRKAEWDLPAWMEQHLQGIHPNLMWEFGSAVRGDGHRLVITPESERWLRPLVSTLLERAPKIAGWEFYPHRVAEGVEDALASVEARVGVEIADATVELLPGDHHRVGLRYTFNDCTSEEDQEALHAAFVATESLAGEAVLDQWIGAIEVAPRRKRSLLSFGRSAPAGVPLDRVQDEVRKQIDALRAALPVQPCIDQSDGEWSLWELKPQKADDYPAQIDLFVGRSMAPEMWMAAHSGPFFSDSFSRHGEVFCYLKMDGSEELDSFEDKEEIEEALDARLRPSRAGCVIGGGTGLRYSYVDLALLDVERGIEIVREVMRGGNITRRAWILFYDDALSAEWVGVWPDSPAPLMRET